MSTEQSPKVHILSTHTIKLQECSSESDHKTVRINLTPSDLELLQLDYEQHGLLYPKPHDHQVPNVAGSTTSLVSHLRLSLQRTLQFFPPLAGRLATTLVHGGTATRFFIECNNAGVEFIHAKLDQDAYLPVAHIIGSNASVPEVFYSFFPLDGARNYEGVKRPLLTIQVTEMVDWLFIGWSVNHLVCDALSFWHFFRTWTEISSSTSISKLPPILNRDGLNLQLVGCQSIEIGNQHMQESFDGDNMAIQVTDHRPLDERVFRFSRDSVARLKARANCEMEKSEGKISSLQAVVAHIWRSIIRCRLSMDSSADIQETTFEIPISMRQRLSLPVPEEYFGNVLSPGIITLENKKMLRNGLGWTAWQVNKMLALSTKPYKLTEFFRIWVKHPKFLKLDRMPRNHFVLIHSPRFDLSMNDFGWGKPLVYRSGKANRFDGRIKVSSGPEQGSMEIEACLSLETLHAMVDDTEFMKYVLPFKSSL